MKNYKEKKIKLISYFFMIVFFIPTIISCSHVESINDTSSYDELALKYKGINSKIKDDVNKLSIAVKDLKRKTGSTITQDLVDQYSRDFGYKSGEVSVEMVNNILNLHKELEENGIENVINSKDLSDFAKQNLIDISRGIVLTDLQNNPDFISLTDFEKEVIVADNVYLKESLMNKSYEAKMAPDGVMAWVILSSLAGYLYAGPPGLLAGLVFGVFMAVMK